MGRKVSTVLLEGALMENFPSHYFKTVVVYCDDISILTKEGRENQLKEMEAVKKSSVRPMHMSNLAK